jgi:hypothetical protein
MIYDFYIQTTDGIKNATVESTFDFSEAPFGAVPYRQQCSCECSAELIFDFWRCIDDILLINNIGSDIFIRAIRAYSSGKLYGEIQCH